ncbi:hypothetical protein DKX38_013450 [Salix brachista]|uniref:Uncharacterized protein n=1 Tax=Salix brachista TaxID=2182728 RepID=A0A5N5LRT6_9ROSI|nr:hypothetical protein DKX38_013450 [Salix brachista]
MALGIESFALIMDSHMVGGVTLPEGLEDSPQLSEVAQKYGGLEKQPVITSDEAATLRWPCNRGAWQEETISYRSLTNVGEVNWLCNYARFGLQIVVS